MAQSHPQSQPVDPMNLSLRNTDTAAPAPPWQVEDMIEDAVAPGQRDTRRPRWGADRAQTAQPLERRLETPATKQARGRWTLSSSHFR